MGSPNKRIQYRYDAVGNRVGMTDPDGGRFTYSYNAVNRITQVINPQGDRTSYAYDAGGRRTVKKLANGTRASFSYDAASNLTRLANLKSDGSTISSFNYEYDRVGNRTAVLEADGSRVTWTYDDTYQLTGEHRTGTIPYEDSYSYDAAGNRLLKVHDGARTTYSYDAANQLEWSEDSSGRTTYTFDADGNQQLVVEPTGDRTTTSWDYENRTTLVQLPSGIRNTMAYEPGGLRVKLEESTGTKKFVWENQNYLAETDANDDTQVVYTNEPRVYGNLVSQRRGSDSHWYHFDAIGSTRELTDALEAVTDTRLYNAWGSIVASSGATVYPFHFNGHSGYYHDLQLNQLYVRARRYAPRLGRWASVDPFWLSQWLNPYAYVSSRPLTILDPSGLRPCEFFQWRNLASLLAHEDVRGPLRCAVKMGCIDYCNILCVTDCTPEERAIYRYYEGWSYWDDEIRICSQLLDHEPTPDAIDTMREELYHAITICNSGEPFSGLSLYALDVLLERWTYRLSGAEIQCGRCLGRELLAKSCAGQCGSVRSTCLGNANSSCDECDDVIDPIGLIIFLDETELGEVITRWFDAYLGPTPNIDACARIDEHCDELAGEPAYWELDRDTMFDILWRCC